MFITYGDIEQHLSTFMYPTTAIIFMRPATTDQIVNIMFYLSQSVHILLHCSASLFVKQITIILEQKF